MHPHYSHLLQFGIPGTKSRVVRFVFEFADTFHRDVLWFWGCVWRGWPPQRASRSTSSSRFCPSKTEEPSNWRPSTRRDRQVPQDVPLQKLSICPHFEVICMFIVFFLIYFKWLYSFSILYLIFLPPGDNVEELVVGWQEKLFSQVQTVPYLSTEKK